MHIGSTVTLLSMDVSPNATPLSLDVRANETLLSTDVRENETLLSMDEGRNETLLSMAVGLNETLLSIHVGRIGDDNDADHDDDDVFCLAFSSVRVLLQVCAMDRLRHTAATQSHDCCK